MKKRICPECGGTVTGRSDKIYCCDSCRVNHHNKRTRALAKAAKEAANGSKSVSVRLKEFLLALNNFAKFLVLGIFASYIHFLER